jgi:DNA-binding MarR family transcriptional regulator
MIPQTKIDNLSELIREVGKKIKDFHKEIKGIPLASMSLMALKFVAEKKNPTMKELADQFGITPPSVTALVEPLVESRYLLRELDAKDRRLVRLMISDNGQQILKKSLQIARKGMIDILNQMEEEEVDNLYSGLSHLLKILKKKN